VKALLRLLVRDWSAEGMLERELCYGPLLAELGAHLPVTHRNRGQQRVLIPGCGLGRLPLEVAARGYSAQGNDASYFMLFASSYIMNKVNTANSMRIYPWIHDSNNHFRPGDMLRPVLVPDVAPADMLAMDPALRISMSSGAFLETYSGEEHDGRWDGVVTSFFLDTAPVALEYMLHIYTLLKPGGVWCNMGPLQYHWAARPNPPSSNDGADGPTVVPDSPDAVFSEGYDRSVELSYLEIRHACTAAGFQFLSEATRTCTYSADLHGMAKTVYSCVLFSVRKPGPGEGAAAAGQAPPSTAVPERQSSFGGASVSSTTAAADGSLAGGGLARLRVPRPEGIGGGGMLHAGGRTTPASDGGGHGTDTESALGALAEVASASAAAEARAGSLSGVSDRAESALTAAGVVSHIKDADGDLQI